MTDQSIETKSKIMEVARILFADQGFEGTSVREIAKSADVNVASVNYHFSNKENLFAEILRIGYLECSQNMRALYENENPNLEDLLVHFFNYFVQKSHDLVSLFKMMMSTQHSHHLMAQGSEDQMSGPPGGKVIEEAILKEVGEGISPEELHFAVRCLFSHVIHSSIMFNCCFKQTHIPFTSHADIEKGIRRLSRIVLNDLKKT
jgi:AcrR family transcriptional regulator